MIHDIFRSYLCAQNCLQQLQRLFRPESQMSTCWWGRKKKWITEASRIHPPGMMYICTKCHENFSYSSWDITTSHTDWLRATRLVATSSSLLSLNILEYGMLSLSAKVDFTVHWKSPESLNTCRLLHFTAQQALMDILQTVKSLSRLCNPYRVESCKWKKVSVFVSPA